MKRISCNCLFANRPHENDRFIPTYCDTILGIRCVWGVLVRRSLCLFWRETHPKGLYTRSPTRREEDEGRKVPEKREGHSQQKRAVKRRSVARWESGREETSQQKSDRRLLGPVDLQMPGWPTREDESAFLVACGSFARIQARDSLQMHGELHKNVTDFSLLALGTNPSPRLFVCLFFFLPPSRLCFVC